MDSPWVSKDYSSLLYYKLNLIVRDDFKLWRLIMTKIITIKEIEEKAKYLEAMEEAWLKEKQEKEEWAKDMEAALQENRLWFRD